MVDALVGCLSIFLFCSALMGIFLSIFAIFFVQGASEVLEYNAALDTGVEAGLRENWSSVSSAMFQLFMTITGGKEWNHLYEEVAHVGWAHACLFIFFVAFYYIAFFNVITSVFCEKAMALAIPTTSELIAKRIEKEHHDAAELLSLLSRTMSDDGSHTIDAQQVADFVNSPKVELYFNVRDLKSSSAHKLYHTLCEVHGTDRIQISEFISTLVKLDGKANSIDAHCLQVRQLYGLQQMKAVQKEQSNEISEMRDILELMQCSNPAVAPLNTKPHSSPLPHTASRPEAPAMHVQKEEVVTTLPPLSIMNEALKVLKHLVRESLSVTAVGDEAFKLIKQLVPIYYGSTVPEEKYSDESHLDLNSIILEEAADSRQRTAKAAPPTLLSSSVEVMIREELFEMQQTLDEIQQTIPAFSQCRGGGALDILQHAKTASALTAATLGGDGGLPNEDRGVAV